MPAVVAFMDDLMFLSRVREAARACGVEVRAARQLGELRAACRPAPEAVFVDLDSARLPTAEALAMLRSDAVLTAVPVVGFVSHVNADRAREGRDAGCSRVMARSAFVEELPALLKGAGSG
jgi:CheY-like chemotaxis protein